MHGEEPERLVDGGACQSEGLGYLHRATPAGERRGEVVCASDIEEGCNSGDATVEFADEVGANVGEREFGRRKFFGAHLSFEAVDADTVRDLFGFFVRIRDVEACRSHEEGDLA